MNRRPDFFEKYTNLKQPYCFIKVSLEHKNFEKLKKTQLFYLVNKLTKPFAALGLYEMKN